MATKVNKHTRAGKDGKRIYCPECNSGFTVYHFSWSALTCGDCNEMIDKYDYYLEERQFRSNQGRDPKKNVETYKLIKLSLVILGIILIYLIATNGN